ncbi:hypothetical protein N0V82_009297 [Gnomoniopsis sp. IMI 355080]|nr:hypothetical protein N0V82_009297 [Gnomoniopsis sp. IMI 355080]
MHPQLAKVGIVDLLEADPRPTFIVDGANVTNISEQDSLVAYYNPALAACDDLVDLLDASRAEHAALWEWITASVRPPTLTKTRSSSSSESPSSSFYYLNAQWSKCLVQQRWLVVGANEQPSTADRPRKVRLDSQKGGFGVSGSANTVAPCTLGSDPMLGLRRQSLEPEPVQLVPPPQRLSAEPDWILPEITHGQQPYMDVVASLDWASRSIGPPDTWPPLLKQSFDQILADARPIAIFWGDQYILLYNEAFNKLCGSFHTKLMGKPIESAWPESGLKLKNIMVTTAANPRTIVEDEWRSFIVKSDEDRIEELYIKWSLVPITDGDKIMGFLHPVLDTTSIRLWERRMKTLIDLGDALVTAQGVSSYWSKVIDALGAVAPEYDIPLAALYSVSDDSLTGLMQNFSEARPHGSQNVSKICRFEGGLGVPEGHALASPSISLRISEAEPAPIFRKAVQSPHPLVLQTADGTLPESLLQGLRWRGFGDACKSAVILPIRPTREEDIMGLLLLGLNPRRPYDNDYRQFISLLNQKLTTTLASTVLLEEEARRGRNAVQEAEYEQARLESKLADRTREATESLKKFEAVADFIPIGMAFQNAQGVLTYANDAWHRITGNPQGETGPSIALRDILSYIVEEDRPGVVQAYERLSVEDSVTYECRLVRRNTVNSPPPLARESSTFEKAGIELQGIDNQASQRHILAAARAERAPDGRILQVLTCLTDVTIHRQTAEEAIRRAQQAENLKRMAELATVGMYEIDLEGNLVEANEVFFEMCGLEKNATNTKETLFKPWETSVYEEDLPRLMEIMNKVTNEGTPQTCEVRFKLPRKVVDSHGTEIIAPRWAFSTFMPVRASDGTVESFCGCVSDVSLQKWQLDTERLRKEEALESKRQQENFIDMTSHEMRNPLSAIIHCADAVIASLSKALDLHLNMKSMNSVAKSNGSGKFGGNARQELQLLMESSIENAETIIACAQHQKRIVDDILTMSKLDSKLLAVTPITVDPLEIAKEALKMFEVEARRVDIDLQMKVDPSYQKHKLEYLDLDPSRLKQVLINLLTNALKFTKSGPTRNVTITISASTERPTDSSCSVQFIPPLQRDEYQPPISSKQKEPIYLIVEVKDTGQGLTEDEMKSLFQRFKQASARTHVKYGGSGLGLFISRKLCEMHNGAIGVASQPGVGSTFAFYVEASRPDHGAMKEARATKRTALQANGLVITKRAESLQIGSVEVPLSSTPGRDLDQMVASPDSLETEFEPEPPKIEGVLVVEDNMINQQLTRRGLSDRGFTVDVANHGLEALEKLKASDRWAGDVPPNNDGSTSAPTILTSPTTPTTASLISRLHANKANDLISPTATPTKFPLSLILMDMEMPIQDGLTCTRQIRQLEQQGNIVGGRIPIIAVSANARLEQILEAKGAGCDDVMIKPYRMPELVEKMRVVALQVAKKNKAARNVALNAVVESVEMQDEPTAVEGPGPPGGDQA